MNNIFKIKKHKSCYNDCELLQYGIELNNKYEKEIFYLNNRIKIVDKIKELCSDNEKILLFKNHNDDEILVTVTTDLANKIINRFSLTFHAYIIENYHLKKVQTLFADVDIKENNEYYVHIIDFVGEGNKGYGTIVMEQFLEYLKTMPVSLVTGWLSPVDLKCSEEHKELLLHFYSKFGFKITEDNKIFLKF